MAALPLPDHRDSRVRRASRDQLDHKAHRERWGLRVFREFRDHKECRERER